MGMTLALRLAEKGHDVTIFEAAEKPGGLTSSWSMDGVVWDRFYHVILMSDLKTRQLLREIGLESEINWVETKTGFYSEGKLYSMSNLIEFFKFPPINLIDKFRLGLTIFVASKLKNWQRLEKMPVSKWLIRWSGKRVFRKIWLPLLKAKLGDNYKKTSAAFIWATIQRMYAARRSGLKKEMFGYVSGGYDRINQKLAMHLRKKGVKIVTNVKVTSVQKKEKVTVQLSTKDEYDFDKVISTLSSKASVQIAPGLTNEEKEKHNSIDYLGVVCPSMLLKKPVSPYYVTNITEEDTPFTGIIEMTALVSKKQLKGYNLVYLPKYIVPESPMFSSDDEDLRDEFLGAFFKMYPEFSDKDVHFWGVSKARVVFALPTIGYSQNLPGIQTSVKDYYIVNSAQIINGTLNVNETIQVAESKLEEVINEE